jgi:hypothetical protein
LNIDLPDVSKLLLTLHRDRCIEYTRDNVQLTERGKEFIDRLALQPEILSELLDKINLVGDLREVLHEALKVYRKRSFSQYFASVTAIRTWEGLCQRSFLARDPDPDFQETGKLAILLRDLTKSRVFNRNVTRQVEAAMGEGLKNVRIQIYDLNTTVSKYVKITDTLVNALGWVDACDTLADAEDPITRIRDMKSGVVQVFCAHEQTRDLWDLDSWRTKWTQRNNKVLLIFDNSRSGSEFLDKASTALREFSDRGVLGHVRQSQYVISGITPLLRQSIAEFLVHLNSASTLDDLSERTNTNTASLRPVIEQIAAKTIEILQIAGASSQLRPTDPSAGLAAEEKASPNG